MTEEKDATPEKTTSEKKAMSTKITKDTRNTMDIKLINSKGSIIEISGAITDKEIKTVCFGLSRTNDQTFTLTPGS